MARFTVCASSLKISVGELPCCYSVAIRVNWVMLVSLCAKIIYPVVEEDEI